jgi:2-iminoacetate synthase
MAASETLGGRMHSFELDQVHLEGILRRAQDAAARADHQPLLERARTGTGLSAEEIALLWWGSVSTEQLHQAAAHVHERRHARLETFSPLYLTNTCDAECLMCGMRRENKSLRRETADIGTIEEQLRLLLRRGMQAVALLTGEYRAGQRGWAMEYVNRALGIAHDLGFKHILINVGSIDPEEFAVLLDGIPRRDDGSIVPKLTMCTFQETYSRPAYAKFMGTDEGNPRSDFDRRLQNFDRAFDAGMRVANPGVLLGLNSDVGYELLALAMHVQHLLARGMEVYASIPRLRQISGGGSQGGVSDDKFTRIVALLALAVPDCKIVITTRESAAVQQRLASIVTVISAGSSAVTPYTEDGARFPLEASQFEVIDQRPFEKVLHDFLADGVIENFAPPTS